MKKAILILSAVLVAAAALLVVACSEPAEGAGEGQKIVVLGFDGMDPVLAQTMIDRGELPNLARLAAEGSFHPLGTSVPPLSPTAWSDFITGMDSGGHGIFEFLHRNPATYIPEFAIAKPSEPEYFKIPFLDKEIQTGGGEMQLLRRGKPFWATLEEHGVETTILRMPVNFPPTGTATRELSGMGTPDLLGTYGTFSFYTSELFAFSGQEVDGGDVYEAWPEDGVVLTELHGPLESTTDLTLYLDPEVDVVKFVVGEGESEFLLQAGEWSNWMQVSFKVGSATVHGICRFYLRRVRPELELYVTPLNIDPHEPLQVISTPEDYAGDLAEETGIFYTQGMPEDTKALSEGVLTRDEFIAQAKIAGGEIKDQFPYVLDDFLSRDGDGLLFYYSGNVDMVSHMMWRTLDPEHPAYDPEWDPQHADVIPSVYRQADEVVGEAMARLEALPQPGTRLVVMSDHGFSSLRRTFHVNNWLRDEGYLAVKNPNLKKDPGLFMNVDWSKTRAYALGLNGFYINLKGRERDGIVDPSEKKALLEEIGEKLLAVIDPETGGPVVTKYYISESYFKDHGALAIGPDMILGFAKGTKGSDESSLGELSETLFEDNLDEWSGDHGMDHETVPGVLFTDRPFGKPAISLKDLAASILGEYGITGFPEDAR